MTDPTTPTATPKLTTGAELGKYLDSIGATVTGVVEYDSKTPLKDYAEELRAKSPKLNRKARRAGVAQSRTAGWKRMFNASKENVMAALGSILKDREAEAVAAAKPVKKRDVTLPTPYGNR